MQCSAALLLLMSPKHVWLSVYRLRIKMGKINWKIAWSKWRVLLHRVMHKHTFCSCNWEIVFWGQSLCKILVMFEVEAWTSSADLWLVFVGRDVTRAWWCMVNVIKDFVQVTYLPTLLSCGNSVLSFSFSMHIFFVHLLLRTFIIK